MPWILTVVYRYIQRQWTVVISTPGEQEQPGQPDQKEILFLTPEFATYLSAKHLGKKLVQFQNTSHQHQSADHFNIQSVFNAS